MPVDIPEIFIKASIDGPGAIPGPDKTLQFVAIDDFLIDCILNENHTLESEVTQYPVESGSSITDNVRPLPITVDMECIVSNSPIGLMADQRDPDSKPSDDAYEMLIRIRNKRDVVTIRTTLRTYENMVLKNLTIPRASGRGDELRFSATFQQIQVVENKRTIRVSIPTGKKKKKITKSAEAVDMRQILIDPKTHSWFDPDLGAWRKTANLLKTRPIVTDTIDFLSGNSDGLVGIENTSKWHLYRGTIDSIYNISRDDPFDALRFDGDHPIRHTIVVTLNQCVLDGFTIKRALPDGKDQPRIGTDEDILRVGS